MSNADLTVEDIELPIKRTDGETLEERMTGNAYHNILPARYLRKNAEGEHIEEQEELFERVGKNIALAEAVYEAERRGIDVEVTPDQLKPDHPRRDELAAEVFGPDVTADDDVTTTLTEENVNKCSYETIVPVLPDEIAAHVEETAEEFQDAMENLSFTPNCVPPDSLVAAEGGIRQLDQIEPGERVHDDVDGNARVDSKFENGEKQVLEIRTSHGYRVRATPEHYFRVIDSNGEYAWRQVKDITNGDFLAMQRDFLDDDSETADLARLQPLTDGGATTRELYRGRPREPIAFPSRMTPELAEWLGMYFGDGTGRESGVRVAFDSKDHDLVDHWVRLTERLFEFTPTVAEHGQADCVIGRSSRRELHRFLEENDLRKESSVAARIPAPVLDSGRSVIAAFLRGLFEADGTINQRSIELYSHSDDLIHQVQLLLLGLGIRSKRREKRDGYRLSIRKNECGARFVERIGFLSQRKRREVERFTTFGENATTFKIPHQTEALLEWYRESDLGHDAYKDLSQCLIDSESEYSQEISEQIFEKYVNTYPELDESPVAEHVRRNQFYDEVEEIRNIGSMRVEDMHVPRRNTYVVEGFVSHNSPTLMNAGDELQQLSACIAGHAPVYTRAGVKRMDDIEVGDEVLTHKGRFREVTAHWSNGTKDTIEMLRGAGKSTHYDVQLTPDHEVLDRDAGWVQADEVENPAAPTFPRSDECPDSFDLTKYRDRIKKEKPVVTDGGAVKLENAIDPRTPLFDQQNNQPTADIANTPSLAWLIGLYLAEGDVSGSDLRITLGSDENGLASKLINRVHEVFGLDVSVSESNEGNWTQYRVCSSFVADFFAKTCGVGGTEKRIPSWVGNASEEYRRSLLNALIAGDGTELQTGYRLVFANPNLAYETTLLARSLGFDASYRHDMSREKSANPTAGCYISTAETTKLDNVHRREAGPIEVFDMEVEGDHSFVVGNFVVHNCFVMSPDDDISDIHETAKKAAEVFQSGGGVGYGFWQLRPYGDSVGSTGGIASGPITFMRTFDQMCFPPGTKILSPDGNRAIESFATGDVVIDEHGYEQPVTDTMERHVDEEIVEIVPERVNKPIRATGEHPFKVAQEDGVEWVDAADLQEGDYLILGHSNHENGVSLDEPFDLGNIASGPLVRADGGITVNREYYGSVKGPRPQSINRSVRTADLATVAGWYLAEGCVVYRRGIPNEVTFTLHHEETKATEAICAAIEGFGITPRVDPVPERNTRHIRVESSSFAQLIEGLFGSGSAEKRIPSFLWSAPVEVQSRVVEALFDGDGNLETRGNSQRVQLKLTNEEIIDWVFQVGLRCGVQFSRHNRMPDGKLPTFSLSASVSTAIDTPLECLFNEVPDDFRATDRTKNRHGREVVKVRSIDRVQYEGPVYNIEVADSHTYVAEDIVVHNCETIAQGGTRRGAQMAIMRVSHPDVIEFIHAKNKDVSLAQTLKLNDPDDYTYTTFSEALEEARELIDEEGRVPKHLRNAVEGHLSNFNISVGVTDAFMEALQNGAEYTFTNPRTEEPHIATEETKEMYERYGLGEYVEVDEELSLPADVLWERIVQGAHENGEPGVIYLERVNKEHSFDIDEEPDHRILATNPCVTGDTEIALADGSPVSIKRLAERGDAVDVLCRHSETDELVVKAGRNPRLTRRDVGLVAVETEQGSTLRCTADHEIWTPDGYVEAGNLSSGDVVIGTTSIAIPAGGAPATVTETLEVSAVTNAGSGDVYNITVDDHHNYLARSEGDEFMSIANCGEQPLEEYEACNLGHINLSTLAAEGAPDWRVWSEQHIDGHDDLEHAMGAFLDEAIDWEEFDRRIELGTRFLENVVTMSDFPVDEITETVRSMRKIGLGVMGLAQLYIQLGMRYGSAPANEVARQLMTHINHGAKWTSHELAEERGSFTDWPDSKYADPVRYREWFEHQTSLQADDWEDGFPIRNHNVTTIAPTGTTSMVGNTTGGCEPIYNVAYYKNVSDDVQGDEMLVEFDDYFLRVLEANDIDVEAVKAEAQEQMANNAFDGLEGLDRVPDAIGELFVTTSDISAKEHAGVQCACQNGVDSAISKTVNAPHHSTVEDAREVFEYIYEHGGKGVTYYRDGTRSKQVLTTRADNADFADEEEAAQALVDQIEEVFGSIEAFTEHEAVRDSVEEEIEALTAAAVDPDSGYAQVRPRPDVLNGVTQRIATGYGKVYVNINEDEAGRPFELFATIGNSGGFTNSFTEALAKTVSTALRSGVDPREIADELQGIRSPKVAWDNGQQITSVPDAIGTAMQRYLDGEVDPSYPQQQNLTELEDEERRAAETDGGPRAATPDGDATQRLLDAGESPECPDCGGMALNFVEGCKTCSSCGWSEC